MNKRKLIWIHVSTILMICMFVAFPSSGKMNASEVTFKDLKPGDQGYEDVMSLVKENILHGYNDQTFKPYRNISRNHAAVLLSHALQLPIPSNIKQILAAYSDVDETSLYAKEIAAVTEAGIFKGSNGKFLGNRSITRAQVATVFVQAYDLYALHTPVAFTDFKEIDPSHQESVRTLAQHGISIGKQAQDGTRYFAGSESVKRVQFAIFLNKLKTKAMHYGKIESLENGEVTINNVSYQYVPALSGLFAENNAAVLQGAVVDFSAQDRVITSIQYLELRTSGTETNSLHLDGAGVSINGHFKVSGDYLTVQDLIINQDFIVDEKVENRLDIQQVTIKGETYLGEKKAHTAAKVQELGTGPEPSGAHITFNGVHAGVVYGGLPDVMFSALHIPSVLDLALSARVQVSADSGEEPHIELHDGSSGSELDGKIERVRVLAKQPLDIKGNARINLLVFDSIAPHTVSSNLEINNLQLSEGTDPTAVIRNYDEVRKNIRSINGQPNPDYQAPTVPSTPSAPRVTGVNGTEASVGIGGNYTLPTSLLVSLSNDKREYRHVTWESDTSAIDFSVTDEYTFKGQVEGYAKPIYFILHVLKFADNGRSIYVTNKSELEYALKTPHIEKIYMNQGFKLDKPIHIDKPVTIYQVDTPTGQQQVYDFADSSIDYLNVKDLKNTGGTLLIQNLRYHWLNFTTPNEDIGYGGLLLNVQGEPDSMLDIRGAVSLGINSSDLEAISIDNEGETFSGDLVGSGTNVKGPTFLSDSSGEAPFFQIALSELIVERLDSKKLYRSDFGIDHVHTMTDLSLIGVQVSGIGEITKNNSTIKVVDENGNDINDVKVTLDLAKLKYYTNLAEKYSSLAQDLKVKQKVPETTIRLVEELKVEGENLLQAPVEGEVADTAEKLKQVTHSITDEMNDFELAPAFNRATLYKKIIEAESTLKQLLIDKKNTTAAYEELFQVTMDAFKIYRQLPLSIDEVIDCQTGIDVAIQAVRNG
ncbi:S-layer homology domain-containing protein [Radiobacillus deserti]|uniref:SLH domain-containing protein n=1 Tax=Radiobacillus deserti TaxID=2594883 RepID=A0A516KJB4_9BACI|nr:S-layer homology domain-containing protein [Radiobacillus deserti]QDP41484.1 hypothetical protein FN924_15660 [Radiobacillus deserti]